jgi:hypothetical protein
MHTKAAVPDPKPFMPHPNFCDEMNRNIVQSPLPRVPQGCSTRQKLLVAGGPAA